MSKRTANADARIAGLKATESICPYCAVGCGQVVYAWVGAGRRSARDDEVVAKMARERGGRS